MNQDLEAYIDIKRQHGATDEQIKDILLAAGWDHKMVDEHLHAPHDEVPTPAVTRKKTVSKPRNSGTYGLEYAIMMIALLIVASGLGYAISYVVDSTNDTYSFYGDGSLLSAAITASLIVSLPIYTFLFFRTSRQEVKAPSLRENIVRKISIYAALIITFLTTIGHIMWSVFMIISGGFSSYYSYESDSNYSPGDDIVRAVVVLLIAAPIFAYYYRELRKSENKS